MTRIIQTTVNILLKQEREKELLLIDNNEKKNISLYNWFALSLE